MIIWCFAGYIVECFRWFKVVGVVVVFRSVEKGVDFFFGNMM